MKAVIGNERQCEPVGQRMHGDVFAAASGFGDAGGSGCLERVQNRQRELPVSEACHHPPDVSRRDALDRRQMVSREVEVAGFVPVGRQIGRAARGARKAAELAHRKLALRFGQILCQRQGAHGAEFFKDRLDQCIAFGRLRIGRHGEQPLPPWSGPGKGGDFKGQFAFFPQAAVQQR